MKKMPIVLFETLFDEKSLKAKKICVCCVEWTFFILIE